MQDFIGKSIGRYKIISRLGEGGMATVYRAEDSVLERSVAIKVILPDYQQTENFLKRFEREAKALAQLSHPNIVKILDFGEFEGYPYLVMEYVSNGTLQSIMRKQDGPVNWKEASAMVARVARSLDNAHAHKLIHRDVKPANILINESGQPMLSDFGIVKIMEDSNTTGLTATGTGIGTPHYMSPEQAQGQKLDGRTDIYSLGVIFFEMVTGKKPFEANTPMEVALKHVKETPPHVRQLERDLPPAIDQIIFKAMAKKPEDRYPDMKTFAEAIEAQIPDWSSSQPFKTVQVKKKKPAASPDWKKHLKWILPAVLALAVIIGFLATRSNTDSNLKQTPTTESVAAVPTMIEPTVKPATTKMPTKTPAVASNSSPTAESNASEAVSQPAANTIRAENVNTIIEINRLERVSVVQMAWSPDGKTIAVAGGTGITLIDSATLQQTSTIKTVRAVLALTFAPDSQTLAYISDSVIHIIDLTSQKEIQTLQAQGTPNSLAYALDSNTLAVGMLDNKVLIMDVKNGTMKNSLKGNFGGWAVAYSPDGTYLASGSSQGVLMWEADTGFWMPITGGQNDLVKTLAFSPDNTLLAAGSQDMLRLWHTANGDELFHQSGSFGNIYSVSFSPDGNLLVTAADDGYLRFYESQTGKLVRELQAHSSAIFSAAFSPDGQSVVSGANEGVIRLWALP